MTRGLELFLKSYFRSLGIVAAMILIVAIGIWSGLSPVRMRDLLEDFFKIIVFITGHFGVIGSAVLVLKWKDTLQERARSASHSSGRVGGGPPIGRPGPDAVDEPPG